MTKSNGKRRHEKNRAEIERVIKSFGNRQRDKTIGKRRLDKIVRQTEV